MRHKIMVLILNQNTVTRGVECPQLFPPSTECANTPQIKFATILIGGGYNVWGWRHKMGTGDLDLATE